MKRVRAKYYLLCISIFLCCLSVYGQKTDTTHSTMYIKKVPPKIEDTTIHRANIVAATGNAGNKLNPKVTIGGASENTIRASFLQTCQGIEITDFNFSDTLNYNIVSFDLCVEHSGNTVIKHSKGRLFTQEMIDLLNHVVPGDTVIIQSVLYQVNNSGKVLSIKGLNMKVTE
jgi:hypothetical protein